MMKKIMITATECTCERCGGMWIVPQGTKPPNNCRVRSCRSPYWNQPISRPKISRIIKAVRAGTYRPKKQRTAKP